MKPARMTSSQVIALFDALSILSERAPLRYRANYDTRPARQFLTDLLSSYIHKAGLTELSETAFSVDPSLLNESFLVVNNKMTQKLMELVKLASRKQDDFLKLCQSYGMNK